MAHSGNEPAPRGMQRSARHSVAPGSVVHRLLLGCGVVGPVLFTVTYLIEGAIRPGYDPWREAVSALSLGPGGWVQSANFIVFGLLIACSAVGWRAALVPGVAATWGPLLQGVVALGLIVAGLFAQDPTRGYPPGTPTLTKPTGHAVVHLLATTLTLTARAAWCFVISRRFAREPGWRGWSTYSVATGILTIAFLAAFGVANAHDGPAGLFERLATIVTSLLTVLSAARLLAGTGRVSRAG